MPCGEQKETTSSEGSNACRLPLPFCAGSTRPGRESRQPTTGLCSGRLSSSDSLVSGEFTCPSHTAFSSAMLTVGDVAVDSHISPTRMTVLVKQSKTDPFGAGTTLQFGATGDYLCPVTAMLGYLAVRPPSPGPLFVFEDGATLSRARLVQSLHEALVLVGMDDGRFSGHGFRIGAATAAASAGLQDSLIKTLGRWRSSAYTVYIQTPWQRLAAVLAALSSASSSIT